MNTVSKITSIGGVPIFVNVNDAFRAIISSGCNEWSVAKPIYNLSIDIVSSQVCDEIHELAFAVKSHDLSNLQFVIKKYAVLYIRYDLMSYAIYMGNDEIITYLYDFYIVMPEDTSLYIRSTQPHYLIQPETIAAFMNKVSIVKYLDENASSWDPSFTLSMALMGEHCYEVLDYLFSRDICYEIIPPLRVVITRKFLGDVTLTKYLIGRNSLIKFVFLLAQNDKSKDLMKHFIMHATVNVLTTRSSPEIDFLIRWLVDSQSPEIIDMIFERKLVPKSMILPHMIVRYPGVIDKMKFYGEDTLNVLRLECGIGRSDLLKIKKYLKFVPYGLLHALYSCASFMVQKDFDELLFMLDVSPGFTSLMNDDIRYNNTVHNLIFNSDFVNEPLTYDECIKHFDMMLHKTISITGDECLPNLIKIAGKIGEQYVVRHTMRMKLQFKKSAVKDSLPLMPAQICSITKSKLKRFYLRCNNPLRKHYFNEDAIVSQDVITCPVCNAGTICCELFRK
jgi:hypothetical protein